MKKNLLFLLFLFLNVNLIYSQGDNCASATPFCANTSFPNNTNTTAQAGPSYGCLGSEPNPEWFFIKTTAAGTMTYNISQATGGGVGIDVDFIAWGPFASMANACNTLTGSCAGDHNCSGNIEDCSYSTAAVETMTIASPGAGNYYVILITNYSGSAGDITFTQTGGPATDCSITCPTVLGGNGYTQPGGAAMPATIACNSADIGLIASNNTPFGNPITPALIINFNNNANASNWVQWYENGSFILCAGPAGNGCGIQLVTNTSEQLQYSTMSPSATNNILLCETNSAEANMAYTIVDPSTAPPTILSSGTWVDDGVCQTISIPPGSIQGVSSWSIAPACAGCLTSTDWGYTVFHPSIAGPGTYSITYSFNPPGTCPTYTYSQSITVTNPYVAAWTAPAAMCANAASLNLTTLLNGGSTAGGTWSGTGVTGTTFNPSGLSGTYPITYTVGTLPCGATVSHNITVNPNPILTITPPSQSICSASTTSITLSGGTAYTWTAPTQVSASGGSSGSGSSIAQVLTATGAGAGTVTYTVTATASGCSSTGTVVVTVNPKPTMTSASTATICSGGTVSIPLTSSSPSTYTWIATDNPNTAGESTTLQSTSTLSNTLTNATGSVQTVTYTVTPTATTGGCVGTPQTVTVTVNPKPTMTSANTATICSGGTVSIPLTSSSASTYTWIATDNPNTTGESTTTQSTATLSNTITNTTGSVQTVTYTVTPTAGACAGTPQTVTVTVNPKPTMTSASTATICSGGTVSIPLTSSAASTYTWIATDNANTTGESTTLQSTSTLSNTITNNTGAVQIVTYTVTPTATSGGCVGTPQTVTVTVNPKPIMSSASTATICSGATVSIPLTSSSPSTYTWIATDNVNTTGESTTLQSTGTLSNTITNTTGAVQTVTYTVTPTATSGGCVGTPQTVTVTVNPKPTMTSANTATICSGATVSIPLTSSTASTYTWIATDNPNTTGESFTLQSTSTLSNTITNSTGAVQTVSYTVTATATTGGCVGTPQTVTVTVNPKDNASFSYSSSTYCQTGTNPSATITGLAGGSFTSSPAGLVINSSTGLINLAGSTLGTYNVTYTTNGPCPNTSNVNITISSAPSAGFSYAGSPFCQYGSNPTPTFVVGASAGTFSALPAGLVFVNVNTGQINLATSAPGTYTVTNAIAASGGCAAASSNFSITINPAPVATATPALQSICSGSSTGIALTSSLGAGTTFNWTVVQTGISGASNGSGSSIAQTLSTLGTVSGTAVYTITPSFGGCTGNPITVTITVNPIPNVTATPNAQTLCSGTSTSIALASNVSGTTFAWTVSQVGVSGATAASGITIAQTLLATGVTPGTATYTITPSANGCSGTPITVIITVNPIPFVTATPNSQTICSGGTTSIALSSFTAGTTFDWTISQVGASGASAGNGTSISQTLNTTGSTVGNVIYTITPTSNGCAGTPITVNITINPTPDVTSSPSVQTICSGGATSFSLNSSVAVTTFAWTVSQAGVSGALAGNGASINQTLTNSGAASGTAVYTITPSANSCTGLPIYDTAKVNPNPIVTATPSTQSICSGANTSIALSSNIAGSTFTWTVTATNVSGASNGSGAAINQILTATGTTSGTVDYTVIPSANGCPGNPITITITVNPIPIVTATPSSQTICSGGTTGISISADVTGTTFNWTMSQTGATGANNGNGSSITDILSATGILSGTVIYTITPTYLGCTGAPIAVNITVNPTPVITVTPTTQTFCDGGTTNISLTADVSGTTISWTVVQSLVSGGSNGSGVTIADLLTVTGTTAGSAIYTITSAASGCPGAPVTATVTVNPIDDATFSYSSSTFCQTGPDPSATISGLSGGTFSVSPSGLILINTSTGLLDLSASSPGNYIVTYQTNGICPNSSTFNITISNSPTASFTYASPFCSTDPNPLPTFVGGSSAGVFSATPSGLVFINNTTGEVDLTNSASGTFMISNTIAAAGGCAPAIDSSSITINQAAIVNAGLDGNVCEASSYNLAGVISGGASSATWTSNGTGIFTPNNTSLNAVYSPSPADVSIGIVTLTLTTDNPAGTCPAVSDSIVLAITPLDSATFSYADTTFCQSATNPVPTVTGITGGTFSSTLGLVFVSTSTGEINLASSIVGTYIITYITNGACPNTNTESITITSAPIATFGFTSNDTSFCQSDPNPSPVFGAGAFSGVFSSTPIGLIFISTTTGQIDLTNSIPGTYTITNTIVAANGCATSIDSLVISINLPATTNAGSDGTICSGQTYTISGAAIGGSASGSNWTTSGSGTFDNSALLGATYTPSNADITAGSVTLTITTNDPAGVCGPVTDSQLLTINTTPPPPGVSNTSITACSGVSVAAIVATGTGGIINWYSDAALTNVIGTGNSYTPGVLTNSTSYWLTETLGVCQSSATQINITINPLPIADTTAIVITPANCGATTGAVIGITMTSGQSPYTYAWQDSSSTNVGNDSALTNVGAGLYTLTVTDGNGCSTTVGPFTVTSTLGVVSDFSANPITGETPLSVDFTNTSIGAINYVWQFGTGATSTAINPTYVYIPLGNFTVCLIADNGAGCADTSCATIDVYINSTFVIPNVFTPNDDNVNDVFAVQNKGLKTMDAEIFNRWGEKMFEWHTTNGGWDGRTTSGILAPEGTYYYIITATGIDGKEYFEKGGFTLMR